MRCEVVTLIIVAAFLPFLGILGKTISEQDVLLRFSEQPVAEIPDGKIVGTYNVTDRGTSYVAFRGIPFAQPPLGDLRFSSPIKNSGWSGYWDGTQDANICIQGSGDDIVGSEDCLYINVYAPKGAKNLAVMVWIYGGAFTSGDSTYNSYAPDFLLDDNVVFVSFNYRLGIFGFLSTEDQNASGNWGLKDQVLALKWIRENIGRFGGDPAKVTIFGESAGGASVSYLLQIPQAQGLFDAAIVQSGNSLNLFALTTRARSAAFQVGYFLGIPALLSRSLLQRFRALDAYRLQRTAMSVNTQLLLLNPLRGLVWAPSIEVEGPDAVFTKNSDVYLRTGQYPNKVPIMLGFTSNEAGHAHGLAEELRTYLTLFEVTPSNLVPFSLTSRNSVRNSAASDIRLKFFGQEALAEKFYEAIRFINIDQFTRGALRTAENVSPFVNVYFYVFGYIGDITGENPYDGAGHAEELFYLFKQPGQYSRNDLIVRDKLVRLWTNFAKAQNPTPRREVLLDNVIWPTVNPNSVNTDYVWLNLSISTDTNPSQGDYQFYKEIFNKYGDGSFTTY